MKKLVGPATAVLENPDTGNTDLGFAQPVAVERLVPFDLRSWRSHWPGGSRRSKCGPALSVWQASWVTQSFADGSIGCAACTGQTTTSQWNWCSV